MLPRKLTRFGLGLALSKEPALPLPPPDEVADEAFVVTLPSAPVAKAEVVAVADAAPPKSGMRVRCPLVVSEVVSAKRDARWEKD